MIRKMTRFDRLAMALTAGLSSGVNTSDRARRVLDRMKARARRQAELRRVSIADARGLDSIMRKIRS